MFETVLTHWMIITTFKLMQTLKHRWRGLVLRTEAC